MARQHNRSPILRAVVLGVGGQGLRRSQAIRQARGWELAGVHDFDHSRAMSAAKSLKCPVYPDMHAAIDRSGADVVVIATPPFAHDDQIEAALAASCHVLCEKPLTIRADAARQLSREAERRGLVLATGFNHRFYGPVRRLLNCAASGLLGPILRINAAIGHPPDEATLAGWLGDTSRSGGGVLIDNGSHLIDLLRLFTGEIGSVTLESARWHAERRGIDTSVRFFCESTAGIPMNVDCSWEIQTDRPYLSLEIVCQRGTMRLSAFPWTSTIIEHGGSVRTNRHWGDRIRARFLGMKAPGLEPSLIHELEAIGRSIRKQPADSPAEPFATAHDGIRAAEVVESIQAQANHEAQAVPFGSEDRPLRSRCA